MKNFYKYKQLHIIIKIYIQKVSLQAGGPNNHHCDGVIIGQKYVLTAKQNQHDE